MKKFLLIFVSLLLGVVIGVGIWHGIAYKDELKTFADNTWSKIESVFKKTDETPSEDPNDDTPTPDDPTPETPHEHLWGEWTITFAPTCTESGTQTRTCDCGEFENQTISALGHDYVDSVCTRCDSIFLDGFYFVDINGGCFIVQIENMSYRFVSNWSAAYDYGYTTLMIHEGWDNDCFVQCYIRERDERFYALYYEDDGKEINIGVWDSNNNKLYYDLSNGTEDPWLIDASEQSYIFFEMVKYDDVVIHDSEDLGSYIQISTCTDVGFINYYCSICGTGVAFEEIPALGGEHDFVNSICSRCGDVETPKISLDGNLLTIENYVDLPDVRYFLSMYVPRVSAYYAVYLNENCETELSQVVDLSTIYIPPEYGLTCDSVKFSVCVVRGSYNHWLYSNDVTYSFGHDYDTGACLKCGAQVMHHSMMTDEMFAHMTRANVEGDLGCCTLVYNADLSRFEYDFGDYKLCLGWLNDNYYFYVEGKCDNVLLEDGLDISSAYGYFDGLDYDSSTII